MDALHQLGFGEEFLLRLRGECEEIVSLFNSFDLVHPLLSFTGFTPLALFACTVDEIGEIGPRIMPYLCLSKRGVAGGILPFHNGGPNRPKLVATKYKAWSLLRRGALAYQVTVWGCRAALPEPLGGRVRE